jgi:hypothetical protein
MSRFHSASLLVLGALAAVWQSAAAQESADRAMIARIRAEGTDRSHVVQSFRTITDSIGPRLTGSPSHKTAAEWARAQLAAWGMSNVRLEAFPFGRGWALEKLSIEMVEPRYFPLTGFPEAWTPSTKGALTGAPLYLGDKTAAEVEALAARVSGAIVLAQAPQVAFIRADRPQPADTDARVRIGAPSAERSEGKTPLRELSPLLQKAGAGVVLRPNQGEDGTIFVTGNRATADNAVPSIVLVAEHYNMIARMVQSGIPVKLRVELRTRYYSADTNSYNVLAEIPGEDPVLRNEVVIIGAHLDSWHSAAGGTDNADAAAALMESMRILKAVGAHPRRTIRLALWGGEEQGLLGSRAYVDKHLAGDANAAERDRIAVYLNNDPGTGPSYGFYMEENSAAKSIFDAWLEPLKDAGAKRNVMDKIGSTDHLSFTRVGIPAFTTIQDYRNYDTREHHTNADFPERVSEADLKQQAIVMAVFAWQAAMRDQKIPRQAPVVP